MKQSDLPEDARMPGASADSVMHASIKLGDAFLMGSDDPTGTGGPKVGAAVAYTSTDAAESKRVFDALADGGEITGPFGPTFWSTGFGMCTDRFGVPWMVDTAGEPPAG
jgi:PhnB protein